MSAQPVRQGEERKGGEEHKGADDSSHSSASTGHKRESTALTGSSLSTGNTTQGAVSEKSRGEAPVSAADGAAANSSQPAASSASRSPSTRPQTHSSPFRCSLRTLLRALEPLLQALKDLVLSSREPQEASTDLQEAREALQKLQAMIVAAPELQPALQPLWRQVQNEIQKREQTLVEVVALNLEEQTELQQQLEEASADAVSASEARSASSLMAVLMYHIGGCLRARRMFLADQLQPHTLTLLLQWITQASSLLEQLAAELTADEIRADSRFISACVSVGALSGVQRMLQLSGCACAFATSQGPYLSSLASPDQHFGCLAPLLHFLRYGLDPTLVSERCPHSPLQLARSHIKKHPLPSSESPSEKEWLDSLLQLDESGWLPNLAVQHAAQQPVTTWMEERQRRSELHTRFMHALVAAWSAHLAAVRALLEEPLIPDLADICVEYLNEPVNTEKDGEEDAPAAADGDSAAHAAGQGSESAS